MKTYFDTGVLVKSYILESDSLFAISLLESAGNPIPLSHIHSLEIPNAIHLKRFRKEITAAQEKNALHAFHDDLSAGRLVRPSYDLTSAFVVAQTLSQSHSAGIGCRSPDILHVAIALEMKCTAFVTFDHRQHNLALKAGLIALPQRA